MRTLFSSRSLAIGTLLFGALAGLSGRACAEPVAGAHGPQQHVAPIERRPPGDSPAMGQMGRPRVPNGVARGEHLPQWMRQHSGLTLEQQQQALEREPGFSQLSIPTQQRMFQRLSQLHSMTPLERQRIMERNEDMERLSPDQRTMVRGAMEQLGSLPPDQRREVARNFRAIRQLPPVQRMAAMNSPATRYLNYQQRMVLLNLIRVAPMLPPPEPPQPR